MPAPALLPLLLMPLMALLVWAGSGSTTFLSALTSSDAWAGLGLAGLIGLSAAAINQQLAARKMVPTHCRGWPTGLPCLMIGTSLLILWGPIGLLAKGLAPHGTPRGLALLAVLLGHLCVTYPYVLQAVAAGRPRACIVPTLAQSLGEFSVTVVVCGNLHLNTRDAPLFIYSYYDPAKMPAVNIVGAILSLLSLLLFAHARKSPVYRGTPIACDRQHPSAPLPPLAALPGQNRVQ